MIITRLGNAASKIVSSEAKRNSETDNVSILYGLNINVAGSSLISSASTNKNAVSKPVFKSGKCTFAKISLLLLPNVCAESSKDSGMSL